MIFSTLPMSTSTAPLVNTVGVPSMTYLLLISFLSESKGSSSSLGIIFLMSSSGFSPGFPQEISVFLAIWSRQVSVGSPTSSPLHIPESLLSMALYNRYLCALVPSFISSGLIHCPAIYTSFTVILFWVRVPVLSEQITDTQPRLSTALSSLIMALSSAIFLVPIA